MDEPGMKDIKDKDVRLSQRYAQAYLEMWRGNEIKCLDKQSLAGMPGTQENLVMVRMSEAYQSKLKEIDKRYKPVYDSLKRAMQKCAAQEGQIETTVRTLEDKLREESSDHILGTDQTASGVIKSWPSE